MSAIVACGNAAPEQGSFEKLKLVPIMLRIAEEDETGLLHRAFSEHYPYAVHLGLVGGSFSGEKRGDYMRKKLKKKACGSVNVIIASSHIVRVKLGRSMWKLVVGEELDGKFCGLSRIFFQYSAVKKKYVENAEILKIMQDRIGQICHASYTRVMDGSMYYCRGWVLTAEQHQKLSAKVFDDFLKVCDE